MLGCWGEGMCVYMKKKQHYGASEDREDFAAGAGLPAIHATEAGWSTGHGRWRKAVVAAWAWRLETRKMNKVGDVQGKQRSRAGLARVAMGIPGSGPSLDMKSMCDPNQVIPMPWDSLSF